VINGADVALLLRGLEAFQTPGRALVLPGTLAAAATLFRVAALSSFLPLVHTLFASGDGRLGRLRFMADYLPLDAYPLPLLLTSLILAFATASAFTDYLSGHLESRLLRSAEKVLNKRVFSQYLSFGQPYHDRIHLSKSAVQVRKIPLRAARLLTFLGKNIKSMLGFLIYGVGMLMLSWQLAAAVFACLSLYFLGFGRLSNRLEEVEAQLDGLLDDASVEAQELLANTALVHHSGSQEYEAQRWREFTDAISRATEAKQKIQGLSDPAVNFIGVAILLVVVHGASGLVGEVPAVEAVKYLLFFLFFRRAMTEFNRFLRVPGEWKNTRRDLNKYFAVMDDSDKGLVLPGEQLFTGLVDDIHVSNLSFGYLDTKPVLRDVNLTIPCNRISVILGPSGSGKSSFIKLLLRDYEYQSGEICANGIDIRQYSTESLLQHTAFLGREAQFFSNTIEYNLKYGSALRTDSEIEHALQWAQCKHMVDALPLGLRTDMGDHGNLFSSGEQQRIALARLILKKDASLFLLDEATSAVDGASEKAIIDNLLSINNSTIVLVTHRLSVIRSDMHVILFENGTVVEQGCCDTLFAAGGPFRKLWDSQQLAPPK